MLQLVKKIIFSAAGCEMLIPIQVKKTLQNDNVKNTFRSFTVFHT